MENILGRLFDLITDLKKDQDVIKEQTIKNTANLELHMLRTEQNEEMIKSLNAQLVIQQERLQKLENKDALLSSLWKISLSIAGFVGTILGIIATIHQLQ